MKELLPTFVKYLSSKGPDSFKYMTALRGVLEEINGYFKSNGPLVHGRDISAADCVLAPLLYQIEIACYELKVGLAPAAAEPCVHLALYKLTRALQEVDLFAMMKGIAKCAVILMTPLISCSAQSHDAPDPMLCRYNDNIRSRPSWQATQYSAEAVKAGWRGKLPSA